MVNIKIIFFYINILVSLFLLVLFQNHVANASENTGSIKNDYGDKNEENKLVIFDKKKLSKRQNRKRCTINEHRSLNIKYTNLQNEFLKVIKTVKELNAKLKFISDMEQIDRKSRTEIDNLYKKCEQFKEDNNRLQSELLILESKLEIGFKKLKQSSSVKNEISYNDKGKKNSIHNDFSGKQKRGNNLNKHILKSNIGNHVADVVDSGKKIHQVDKPSNKPLKLKIDDGDDPVADLVLTKKINKILKTEKIILEKEALKKNKLDSVKNSSGRKGYGGSKEDDKFKFENFIERIRSLESLSAMSVNRRLNKLDSFPNYSMALRVLFKRGYYAFDYDNQQGKFIKKLIEKEDFFNSYSKVVLMSYSDRKGAKSINKMLADYRNNAVENFLVKNKVDKLKISKINLGSTSRFPRSDNKDKNRSVEIWLIK